MMAYDCQLDISEYQLVTDESLAAETGPTLRCALVAAILLSFALAVATHRLPTRLTGHVSLRQEVRSQELRQHTGVGGIGLDLRADDGFDAFGVG
jgi:hypothetical protein